MQPHRRARFDGSVCPPLLASDGARVIIGGAREGSLAEPVRPAADTLFGPRGAAASGSMFVSDTGHHRLLGWRRVPTNDYTPADLVFGQPGFTSEGRNAGREIGRSTLNMPTGIALGSGVLAVGDAWNHRVLLWFGVPETSNRPPDVVLGQADFTTGLANRGALTPAANTLNWCYGVTIHDGHLFVADSGNRRVLMWDKIPEANGSPADLVLGQRDTTTRADHGEGAVGAAGMRWPHAVAMAAGRLFVADAGTNRIMVWHDLPMMNGARCDAVLGQASLDGTDHNRGAYDPGSATLNMPYGIATLSDRLVVADTANSRLLGFDSDAIEMGGPADRVSGQQNFHEKVEVHRRPRDQRRAALCWPFAVAACGNSALIADSGNNRVLLWDAA
jgi:hypothetical protein